jgi:hypothetical protein
VGAQGVSSVKGQSHLLLQWAISRLPAILNLMYQVDCQKGVSHGPSLLVSLALQPSPGQAHGPTYLNPASLLLRLGQARL